jgi:hypothetical protein
MTIWHEGNGTIASLDFSDQFQKRGGGASMV